MLNPSYNSRNRKLKESASRRRSARRRLMNEDFNMIPAPFRKYLKMIDLNAEDYGMEDFDIGEVVADYDGNRYAIISFLDATPDYEDIMFGGDKCFLLAQNLSDKKYYVVEPDYDVDIPEVIPVDINSIKSYFYESMRRKRSSLKRRMNEDLNIIPGPFRKYLQLSDYDDEDDFTVGDIVKDNAGNTYAIISYLEGTPDYEEVMMGENLSYILVQNLSNKNYYVAEYYYDRDTPKVYPIDIDGLKSAVYEESMSHRRTARRQRMNEDSEKRDCTFDVDYEGDYFSDLSSRGIIDFNDVFEKVQNILYFKYPEAYAVKVGYDEIEIRNLTEDDCEFIEDDIYRNLVNWYQDIEEHGNPNRWTESVSRKR